MGRKQCFEERKSSQKVADRLWRRSWDLVILRNEDEGILKVNPEEDGEVEDGVVWKVVVITLASKESESSVSLGSSQ